MSLRDHQPHSSWYQLGPVAPGGTERTGRADATWRAWDRVRAIDRRYAFLVDTLLAAGLLVLSSGWFVLTGPAHPDLGFTFALILPLVLRRRAPIAVFGVIAAVALLQWLTSVPMVADAALLVALYTVAVESHWVQVVAAAAALEVGVIMATVRWRPTGNAVKSVVFLSGLAFAALLAGVVVRAMRNQMSWLAERAQRLERERDQQTSLAAAAERARIAREMHDVVSHNIQVMVTLADAATAAQRRDPERSAEAMVEVSSTGRQALTDMRRLLGVLRDEPVLARDPLLAPQPGLDELDALVERVRAIGLLVSLEEAGRPFALSEAAELTVYRIVQEALTNVMKHARDPHSAVVRVTFDDPDVTVQVTDDGSGPAPGSSGGLGVTGMMERAAAFGGTLAVGPLGNGTPGWRVEAVLRGCKAPVTV
jgi:signal transduction histidine kinase